MTYQLPALLEGRNQTRKITLVVSPLLSLIRDQEEQMNQFAANSAIAFTSGIGTSEQARRWGLVRDSNSGICIIFVTPEKVFKSNKLRSELEKLNDQNRLGRFVIDECKCTVIVSFMIRDSVNLLIKTNVIFFVYFPSKVIAHVSIY